MKKCFWLLSLVLIWAGCASTPESVKVLEKDECMDRVRISLEFGSEPRQTHGFFVQFMSNQGMDLEAMFNVLGRNVSSVMLALEDPYAQQISLRMNPDMNTFVPAFNQRLSRGGSLLQMQDVVGTTLMGEFLRVEVEAPNICSGYFYVHCKEIEGRTVAEQTYVDFIRRGEGKAKLSLESLIGLVM